jgi:hypothetical protein
MKLTERQANDFEAIKGDVETAREELRAATIAYNMALRESHGFVEGIASAARERWDSRSERWQDSDKGQSAATWVEAWESAASELENGELDEPEEGELEGLDIADEGEE